MTFMERRFRGLAELPVYPYCEVNRLRTGDNGRAFINFPVEIVSTWPDDTAVILVPKPTNVPSEFRSRWIETASNYVLFPATDRGIEERVISMIDRYNLSFAALIGQGKWERAQLISNAIIRLLWTAYREGLRPFPVVTVYDAWARALMVSTTLGHDIGLFQQKFFEFIDEVDWASWNGVVDQLDALTEIFTGIYQGRLL